MPSRPWAQGKYEINNHFNKVEQTAFIYMMPLILTNIWWHKQEAAKIDSVTEINISRSESGCRHLRHHRKLSVFVQEVSSFRRAPLPPCLPPTTNSCENTAAYIGSEQWREWLIRWRQADTAQVSVCVHSHRGWRWKTWIFRLLYWRSLISGWFFCLSVRRRWVCAFILYFWMISPKPNFRSWHCV